MFNVKSYLKDSGDVNPLLRKIFSVYVGMILCGIGLIGNFISFMVWRRINRRRSDSGKSAGILLMALALVDSGLLILFVVTESVQQLAPNVNNNQHYVKFKCYFGFPMYYFFIVASIWMVISITYNRFIAVVFPHKAASLNTIKKSYGIIVGTLAFSFIINIPHFFSYRPTIEQGEWQALLTKYGKSNAAKSYDFIGHCMLLVLIPWLTISVLNSIIIYKLCSNRCLIPKSVKGKLSKERQTTIILLTVTFTFLLFLIWQCLTQCFYMLNFKKSNVNVWFDVESAYAPARLGVIFNSSVNFILYCISGSMFRKEMYRMFAEVFNCTSYSVLLDTSSTTVSNSQSTLSSVSPPPVDESVNKDVHNV